MLSLRLSASRSLCLLVLLGSASLMACGGSGHESKTAGDDTSPGRSDGSDGSNAVESEPTGPDCSDGTCFTCGEGFCPKGAYCDEDATGGAACAWLTECAGSPDCGCITSVLGASCSCEQGNGPSVSCQ